MVVELLGQHREVLIDDDHTGNTWARHMGYIAEQMYPNAKRVSVVEDNLSSHKKHNLYNVFEPERASAIIGKIEFIYTRKHGSWLNAAECALSVLSRQALKYRFYSKEALEKRTKQWVQERNFGQKGIDWQFKTADARIKLKKP